MKKILLAIGFTAVLFCTVFITRRSVLNGAVLLKPSNSKEIGLGTIVAEPSKNTDTDMRININTATLKELIGLPGIGETIAQRIIDYREKNGPFRKIEEIMYVSGIGEGKFSVIYEYIKVE